MNNKNNNNFNLGKRMRELRKEKKITQKELCEKSGVFQQHISLIEQDKVSPTIKVLCKLCDALDVSITEVFKYYECE